ncbi:divergent polysaccharide deacetylase family protein [Sinorhizobium medicae]|uniref:divergent polysaccharide deacetylase family protein n=1 Tax=Sinorhizobium medicae TaxID=110321 RepID=UPI002AF6BB1A|nr:divergent polysaccharide deacetylase family protein [Sinorhizobium medicae]WQO45296.1 divergent polysaccharide deacetylase family protein [Sinorhizobium medicae]WQO65459.1 divergent polysaccharide deacetylase family protein [Sinorhizobium medicae]WQO72584.1 divergent polysaccharide deacetylase family protein [Sinorhizobium medicae]WQO91896.1 divergent polysaccharide deacetylase family protein [Sinorhizobium medicae]
MATDLNAPLGQNRKERRAHKRDLRRLLRYSGLSLAAVAIMGLSAWSALFPVPLTRSPAAPTVAEANPVAEASSSGAPVTSPSPLKRSGPLSGADVEEVLTDHGATVRKYTPRPRETGGPAFIDVGSTRGQDPRMAALPNESLLEDRPEGRLPIIGPDGLRPMEQYARPWSGARGTRIAIVVGGLGLSQTGTQRAIRDLPPEVTLAFAAAGNSLQRWMQEARRDGHEILLQVPMEPFDAPDNDPGPPALRVSADARENLAQLHRSMGQITNYTGVMNYLGGRFLSNADALEPVMRDLGKRGLLFLDDGTSAQSLSGTLAGAFDVPHGFADVVLDSELSRSTILRRLDDLERIARKGGTAIGVASAFDESVTSIAEWIEEVGGRGIEVVGVAALVKDPKHN